MWRTRSTRREPQKNLLALSHFIFTYSLIAYIVVLLVEMVWEASISSIMPPNYILIVVLASGVSSIWFRKTEKARKWEPLKGRDYLLITAVGIGVAGMVWYGAQNHGAISFVLSGGVGAIAAFSSLLLFAEVK
jgi:hypothetical protein